MPRRAAELLDEPATLRATYEAAGSIAAVAQSLEVSATTVRRALVRHSIERLPRNRNRRPPGADALDDRKWLAEQYRISTAVDIARRLGTSPRTVYAAMERHGIPRRSGPGRLRLSRPELTDGDWLRHAVESASSSQVAAELDVSSGTVRAAYRRAGVDAASTPRNFARGRPRPRPDVSELQSAWTAERSIRGVGRRIGVAHTTAAVWLAEIGTFAEETSQLGRAELLEAIRQHKSLRDIAGELRVSVTTVRVELHRHGLYEAHRLRHRRYH